jgi:hypothetical protein
MDALNGRMEVGMKGSSKQTISTVRARIHGLKDGPILVSGRKTRCMARGHSCGLMAAPISVDTGKTRSMDSVSSSGQTGAGMKGCGVMDVSTVKGSLQVPGTHESTALGSTGSGLEGNTPN